MFLLKKFFYLFHLVRRKKFGMNLINAQIRSHMFRDLPGIPGQHDRLLNSCRTQRTDCLLRMRFLNVGDHDMAGIFSVYRHMDDSSRLVTVDPLHTKLIHQF